MRRSLVCSQLISFCASLSHVVCCCALNIIEPPIRDHQSAATSLDYDANSRRITCDFGRFHIHMHIQYFSFCAHCIDGQAQEIFSKGSPLCGCEISRRLHRGAFECQRMGNGRYIWMDIFIRIYIVCRYCFVPCGFIHVCSIVRRRIQYQAQDDVVSLQVHVGLHKERIWNWTKTDDSGLFFEDFLQVPCDQKKLQ
jgi:hypothetical protein